MQITKVLIGVLLFCSACGSKGESAELPDIMFDKEKWNAKAGSHYAYRKQMINDLLTNYQWVGVKKDSVIQMLGQPDATEEDGMMIYYYEKRRVLGGLAQGIETIAFEIAPDSTVQIARKGNGGWD